MNKQIQRGLVLVGVMSASAVASAAGTDYTALTSAVDFAGVITAVLAIAATLAGLYVAIRGAKTVVGMIRGR
jgi:hypothetical protein